MMIKKTISMLILLISVSTNFFGQQMADTSKNKNSHNDFQMKTLLGNHKLTHGAYLGLTAGYSELQDRNGFNAGVRLAWIIDHSLALGVAGKGFSEDFWFDNTNFNNYCVQGGYGGILIEPVIMPASAFHLSVPVIFGVGGIANVNEGSWNNYDNDIYYDDYDSYLISEPGIEIEANVMKLIRVSAGASYRFTTPVHLYNVKRNVLQGFGVEVGIKIGKF